jgi:imidazoleglycerol phosphate synthase glutamine amidotransferase subunit HisH
MLDYVAGNVRSLVNAIEKVGYTVTWVRSPADVPAAEVCVLWQRQHTPMACADASRPRNSSSPASATLATVSRN